MHIVQLLLLSRTCGRVDGELDALIPDRIDRVLNDSRLAALVHGINGYEGGAGPVALLAQQVRGHKVARS